MVLPFSNSRNVLGIVPFKPSIHTVVPGEPLRWWPVFYSDELMLTPEDGPTFEDECVGDDSRIAPGEEGRF